jgi:transcriptional regulator with XRE-family HTH domain
MDININIINNMSAKERQYFFTKAKQYLPSQAEIAMKAGVSPALVSYTLRGFGKNKQVIATIINYLPASFSIVIESKKLTTI